MLSLFAWLAILIGLASLFNRIAKAQFFNGAYVFLAIAALGLVSNMFLALSFGYYEAAGVAMGTWLLPLILAFYLGRKFAVAHPSSFPSVLWHGRARPSDGSEK